MTQQAIDFIRLIYSRLSILTQKVITYLESNDLKTVEPIYESFRLTKIVKSVQKLFEPYLRLEKRSFQITYTDIDFTENNILSDQLCLQHVLICLINHLVSMTCNGDIRIIIGFDKQLKVLIVQVFTEKV